MCVPRLIFAGGKQTILSILTLKPFFFFMSEKIPSAPPSKNKPLLLSPKNVNKRKNQEKLLETQPFVLFL